MLKLNEGEETANSYRGLGGMTNLVEWQRRGGCNGMYGIWHD
jgi:hypothetical protein